MKSVISPIILILFDFCQERMKSSEREGNVKMRLVGMLDQKKCCKSTESQRINRKSSFMYKSTVSFLHVLLVYGKKTTVISTAS